MDPPRLTHLRRALRSMGLARLIAGPWVAVLVLTEEPSSVPVWGRLPGVGLAVALVIGGFLLEALAKRARTLPDARRVAIAGLVLDVTISATAVWLYAFQPTSGTWAVLYILPLEAATFFTLRGALATWAATAALYGAIVVAAAERIGTPVSWNTYTFYMGVGFIIALISGLLARNLHRERARLESELEVRRATERELVKRAKQLAEAQDIAHLGAWEWVRATDTVIWSEGLYDIHGVDPETFPGTPESFVALQHPEDRARIAETLRISMKTGSSFRVDYRIVRPDGVVRMLHAMGEVVTDDRGVPSGLFGTIQDVTAQHDAEAALQRANEDLLASVKALEHRNRQATLTAALGEMLLSCTNRAEIYGVVSEFGPQIFPGTGGELAVVAAEGIQRVTGWPPGEQGGSGLFPREACWALRRGRAHLQGASSSETAHCLHVRGRSDAASLCVPLIAQGEPLGVLTLRELDPHGWLNDGDEDVNRRLVQTIAEYVGLALANLNLRDELREQSVRDPLTGLFNRRYLQETLDRELQRATRANEEIAILAIDIDRFKDLNDSAGHGAGDEVLRAFGAFLQAETRAADVACRTGGEEFTIVLPGASIEEATERAEHLRAGCKDLVPGDRPWRMSISVGVVAFPTSARDAEDLLRLADAALYDAKNGGRDRVVACAIRSTPGPLRLAVGE